MPAAVWDAEFTAGGWEYLDREIPRYAVIAGYCAAGLQQAAPGRRRILDLGCGSGALQPWLAQIGYDRYLGVDLSAKAIAQARQRWSDGSAATVFEVGDADVFAPAGTFDVIVCNEMLYYSVAPAQLLARLAQSLSPEGRFVISLWECKDSWRVWRECKLGLRVSDEVHMTSGDLAWDIRRCQVL